MYNNYSWLKLGDFLHTNKIYGSTLKLSCRNWIFGQNCIWPPSCFSDSAQNQYQASFWPDKAILKVLWRYMDRRWSYRAETKPEFWDKNLIWPPSCFSDFAQNQYQASFWPHKAILKVLWRYMDQRWSYRPETGIFGQKSYLAAILFFQFHSKSKPS